MEFSEPLTKFMSENLSFPMRKKGDIAILDLDGQIIGSRARLLEDDLRLLKESGISIAVLNFQCVTSIDSLGVKAILSGLESGLITKVFHMNTNCRDIFKKHNETHVIPILGSEEEAIGGTHKVPVLSAEKRRYKRINANIPIEIHMGSQLQPGLILNVSEGGALLGYLDNLTEDQKNIKHVNIVMNLNLPVSALIELEGKPVRFIEKDGMHDDMHTVGVERISSEKNWRILKQVCEDNTQSSQ